MGWREPELFAESLIAIDGSKFKAVNNRNRNITPAKVIHRLKQIDECSKPPQERSDEQVSLTVPDARSIATSGRGAGMVGYNLQAAVDSKHHLILPHEGTNLVNEYGQQATAILF